jgi:lipopolysaccharide export LptBFGC system permease protein LptF
MKRGKDAAGVDATAINVEINQRIALALAPIAFMMLGLPLAIRTSRRETSIGLILSVALGALYYGGVLVSDALRYNPQFYPQYVVWIPPLLFQVFGIVYLTKIARK